MQAYYEIETDITANHQLHIQLPDTIPQGRAKIAVIYEVAESQLTKNNLMTAFLNSLPETVEQSALSRGQIQAYITEERASWDDD